MTDTLALNNKVAFIQGGSRGIGAAIAKRLAKDGASVALSYSSSPEAAKSVVDSIVAAGGKAIAIKANSAEEKEIRGAIQQTVAKFGRLDILVNSAGVLAMAPIADLDVADLDRTLSVNVRSVVVASQEAVKHMGDGGRIINIGSCNADRMPFPGGAVYAMSKSAIIGLTKGLARDLGPQGITVNNLQPGPVNTDMNPEDGEFAGALKSLMALPRFGTVDEIAGFVAFLASPEAAYITGASLTIDGGFTA